MNQQAVADLVRFALATAARLDQRVDLGPIHLMKLLFIADWAYAQRHNGETYTGIPWKFHHFGPYCDGVVAELERAVPTVGTQDRSFFGSKSGKQVKRWAAERDESTDDLFLNLEGLLPAEVVGAIKRTVQTQGGATYALLHEVYGTLPMRRAAPGELIDFRAAVQGFREEPDPLPDAAPVLDIKPIDPGLSATRKKKQEKAFELLKLRMQEALRRSGEPSGLIIVEPVEDEVFEQGLAWLDPQIEPLPSFQATLNIDPNVWHSSTRRSIS